MILEHYLPRQEPMNCQIMNQVAINHVLCTKRRTVQKKLTEL